MELEQLEQVKTLIRAYTGIFYLTREDCTVVGLKKLGSAVTNQSDVPIFRFQAIVTAPAPDFSNIAPTNNDVVKLQKMNFLGGKEFGPEVEFMFRWKIKKPDGSLKKKKFVLRGQITPLGLIDWEIADGMYYLKTEVLGGKA